MSTAPTGDMMIPSQKTTRASARWRISGPCLAFIALAVVAPAIWSFIGIGNNTGDPFHYGMDEGIFSEKYLGDWLLIPAFYLLLGSLPLGAGAVLLWRRVSDGAFGTIGLSLGLTSLFVLVWAFVSLPGSSCDGIGICPTPAWQLPDEAQVVALVVAALSFPIWLHLGIHALIRRVRALRGFDAPKK